MNTALRIAIITGLRIVAQAAMCAGILEGEPSFVQGLKAVGAVGWIVLTVVNLMLWSLGLGGDRVVDWLSMGYLG